MHETARRARNAREWLWFVLALGIALRLLGLDWDRGLIFNPDEGNIGRAAAALRFPDQLVSGFSAYNGLALYLPRLLAELLALFGLGTPTNPASIVFAGRILSALFACLSLALLGAMARRLWSFEITLFVLVVAGFTPGLIQTAHFATTEAALILCLMVLLWLTLQHMTGRLSLLAYGALVGVVLGIGFGFKTTALIFAIAPMVAVTLTTLVKGRWLPAIGAGALAVVIIAALGLASTPQIWATPAAYFDTMRFEGGVVAGTQDVFWTYQFAGSVPGLFELAQLPWTMGPALALLALAGFAGLCVGIVLRREQALLLAPALVLSLVYAVVIVSWYAKFVRYETPLLPTMVLFAAYAAASLPLVPLRRGVMVLTSIATIVAGTLQLLVYLNPDPRIAAWDWLSPQLADGQHIVIEPVDIGSAYWYGPRRTSLDVVPLIEPSGDAKLARIADVVAAGDWMIVASRRHHAVLPRLRQRFPEMCGYYDALWSGRLGYAVEARFTRRPPLPELLSPELWAEETFTVFDSPEVYVLRNDRHLPAAQVRIEMTAASAACGDGQVPRPPR